MNNHTTYRTHLIKVFDFLSRFVNEADTLHKSEAQECITFRTFLAEVAEMKLRTSHSGASQHDGVACCPEAIQYLLGTYATTSSMPEALEDLRNIRKTGQVEEEYKKCFNKTIFWCGNVNNEDRR